MPRGVYERTPEMRRATSEGLKRESQTRREERTPNLMEHLTLKAVTTTTDQGLFEAVISTETSDREKDVVSAAGMVAALRKWNRPLPLAWNHSTTAEDIFGAIDTQSAREVNGEVVVDGRVDMDSTVGKEAWRAFKARTIGFSFGYLVLQATKTKDGGRNITELDVFEVSATATPMNNGTRVLSAKGAGSLDSALTFVANQDTPPADDTLRESWRLLLEGKHGPLPERKASEPEPEPEKAPEVDIERLKDLTAAAGAPIFTRNEARALVNLPPLEDAPDLSPAAGSDEDPEGKSSQDEDRNGKSAPRNPLQEEAWRLLLEDGRGPLPKRKAKPEPEPEPEPLDPAAVWREAWALLTQ